LFHPFNQGGATLYLTKTQKEILEFIERFIQSHGYSPSLEEIGDHFGYTSLATVHKHLTHLKEKKLIRRKHYSSRSIELVPVESETDGTEVPLLGYVAAGRPIQAVTIDEVISVPADMVKTKGKTYVLQVRGNSMIDEQIRDGDYVMVEDRKTAENGEMVIALIDGDEATLKKFYRERSGNIRLQPANPEMKPLTYSPDRVTIQGIVIGILRKY
jgi:repressor LexA